MNKYTIDFTKCKYIHDVHQAIKTGLEFPDYYGKNTDAFWDCLTDFGNEKFCIEILGLGTLDKSLNDELNIVLKLMKEYREKYNPYLVIKIVYDGDDVFM